ncbi:hypothetical protein ACW559_003528 [Salmonella enterica]
MKIIFNAGWVLVIDIFFVYPDDLMFFIFFYFPYKIFATLWYTCGAECFETEGGPVFSLQFWQKKRWGTIYWGELRRKLTYCRILSGAQVMKTAEASLAPPGSYVLKESVL